MKKRYKILIFLVAFPVIGALQSSISTEFARSNAQTSNDCSRLLDLSDIFADASYCEYKIAQIGEGESQNFTDVINAPFVINHYEARGVIALNENVDISEGFALETDAKEPTEAKEFIKELDSADWVKIADWYILKNFRNTLYANLVFDRNTNLLYYFIVSINNAAPTEEEILE